MGTIRAIADTIFKRLNTVSDHLAADEIASVPAGTKLAIASVVDDKNQHAKVKLLEPIKASSLSPLTEGFVYEPHWNIPLEMMPRPIKLDVQYRNQRDNSTDKFGTGDRQCNLTANAAAADFLLKKFGEKELDARAQEGGYREAESVYAEQLIKYGDTIYHDAHTKALRQFGIESYFSLSMSLSDLIDCLCCHVPVPISVAYKSSGHVVLVVGYNPEKKHFLVHDSYGVRAGSANYYAIKSGKGNAGAFDVYSLEVMRQIWGDVGNKEAGWGRVFTSVAGQATGCKFGL